MTDLRTCLHAIYTERGSLTPSIVVAEARSPEHPLHDRFEWDDSIAAEKWRQEQAHELIRSVKVVYRDDAGQQKEVRAFHSMRRPAGYVYEPVEEITSDPVSVRVLLQDMEREWRQLKRRYDGFTEFWQMIKDDADAA